MRQPAHTKWAWGRSLSELSSLDPCCPSLSAYVFLPLCVLSPAPNLPLTALLFAHFLWIQTLVP